ncbi:MAG: YbaB/EbfC family nucleoid-associated protein [Wenzhouxiangella sp.]|jgi:DNA-binding YbaB/EbfC family protein|nr:YbaB/EbfC family nucleoid-associated protein [Wenzhouxiangella sp.]MDR9452580.1 YbaB/EbfC family nucleoid-associated protein [Wenzhouxiangella sp.]
MKGNIAQLMQQAQKMQDQFKQAQEELGDIEVTGQAGGGLVEVVMKGQYEVRRVAIDPEIADDREMIEDLVAAAINDAINKVQEKTQEKMSGLTGGLNLPPGFQLP